MKKILFLALMLSVSIIYAEDASKDANKKDTNKKEIKKAQKSKAKKTNQKIYKDIILENFENTEFSPENLKFRKTLRQEGGISMREEYPSPAGNSKKYLGVKVFAKSGDTFRITFPKKITIDKYTKSISMWVYGKRFSGILDIWLQDANGRNHRLRFGNTAFLGWKKLTVKLGKNIKQRDKYLEQKRKLKILYLQYHPRNRTRLPMWQYFYLDDLTAKVREKYKDRQSDDW